MTKSEVRAADPEPEEVEDSDEEIEEGVDQEAVAAIADKAVSRGEKKARKALAKHGLKLIPDVTRVTIRRPRNVSVLSAKDGSKVSSASGIVTELSRCGGARTWNGLRSW
jgi:hypothetical protein